MAKILIVEDNQGTNKAICEYMKEAGHTLFSAFTGSEALKIFREKELDIIVLDIMLPEMSGIVVLDGSPWLKSVQLVCVPSLKYTELFPPATIISSLDGIKSSVIIPM